MTSSGGMSPSVRYPLRGEIWWVRLDPTEGSEINKERPCVVLSTDRLRRLPLRTVVPLTGWKPKHERLVTCVRIDPTARNGIRRASAADATQARSVALARFGERMGRLDPVLLHDLVSMVAMTLEAD